MLQAANRAPSRQKRSRDMILAALVKWANSLPRRNHSISKTVSKTRANTDVLRVAPKRWTLLFTVAAECTSGVTPGNCLSDKRTSNADIQLGPCLMMFQFIGETLVTLTGIPFPGPLCGNGAVARLTCTSAGGPSPRNSPRSETDRLYRQPGLAVRTQQELPIVAYGALLRERDGLAIGRRHSSPRPSPGRDRQRRHSGTSGCVYGAKPASLPHDRTWKKAIARARKPILWAAVHHSPFCR